MSDTDAARTRTLGSIAVGAATAGALALAVAFLPAADPDAPAPDLGAGTIVDSASWQQYRHAPDKNAVVDSALDDLPAMTLTLPDEVRATPVVVGDRLYVGTHNVGTLHAFDLRTGEQLWQVQAPNWVHSEMIYVDGMLYVGVGNRNFREGDIHDPETVRGTGTNGVMALDAATGRQRWWVETEGEVMPTPVFRDGRVMAVTGDRHLYTIDADSGELVDKVDTGRRVSMSSPALAGDLLFFGGAPNPAVLTAFDLERGEVAWTHTFPDVWTGVDDVPPAVADGVVVTTGNEGRGAAAVHHLYALDAATGTLLWSDVLGSGVPVQNNRSGAPMIHDGVVYVGSPTAGGTFAYDLREGTRLWRADTGPVKAAPVTRDGVLYVSSAPGTLYALDIDTGAVLATTEPGGKLAPAGPIIVDDSLVVPSQGAKVYIMPIADLLGGD